MRVTTQDRPLIIYYAHGMYLYGSAQEARDIELLTGMGFDVVNPSDPDYAAEAKLHGNSMNYYKELVRKCDGLAFRASPDGLITAGVFCEIQEMQTKGGPVIELPSMMKRRSLDIGQTVAYLHEIGER